MTRTVLPEVESDPKMTDEQPVVYLMRGLPACGKSHTACRLAGGSGVICETDEYFYDHVGDDPTRYDYRDDRLADARQWNFDRFAQAVRERRTPIIVDRGNGLNVETREYVVYARERGYRVELKEPDSVWWQELRVLLKYKQHVAQELFDRWAEALADKSRDTHRVPISTIRRWMQSWRGDLTVEEIVDYEDSDG